MGNEFYKRDIFHLVKVKFNSTDTRSYTYAAHSKLNLEKGDYVVIPTGSDEDVFPFGKLHDLTRIVMVVGVTKDSSKAPSEYDLKHVIQKINGSMYERILNAKKKFKT